MSAILRISPLVLALLISINCYSQKNQSEISKLDLYVLDETAREPKKNLLPFSAFQIVDLRFDTTNIGFIKDRLKYRSIVTRNKFDSEIETKLNKKYKNYLDSSSGKTLVIFIKHFWLHETSNAKQANEKIIIKNSYDNYSFYRLTTLLESFIKTDTHSKAFLRIDSIFSLRAFSKIEDGSLLLPFDNLIEKANEINVEKLISSRKPMNEEELKNYYSKIFEAPRLKKNITEKGIYMIFKDFINNRITDKDFTIQYGKLTDELFIKENGKEIILENFWGFSDGAKNYIRIGMNFYELQEFGNSFAFWGSKHIIVRNFNPSRDPNDASLLIAGISSLKNKTAKNYDVPLLLNMDTGKLY